ncbi:hypothetical protein [Ostreibacterium oceani]|uniref:Uncharacterized protein n=1 Tax=Ostreibacterium oceani TaxID=2654998 RepID=A0A6N7EZW9_9GAMM|nr:hypothetical protein [Ostreibacterium oceani]MPV86909.1 hypothetical protein [Ostreibacterium oceani]
MAKPAMYRYAILDSERRVVESIFVSAALITDPARLPVCHDVALARFVLITDTIVDPIVDPATDAQGSARPVAVGDIYADGVFTAAPPPRSVTISKHAFFARLTMPEKMLLIAPDNVGDMPNMPQLPIEATVMLKVFAKEIELAADIDLDHPALVGGLNQLESMGLLQTGRADEIRGVSDTDA